MKKFAIILMLIPIIYLFCLSLRVESKDEIELPLNTEAKIFDLTCNDKPVCKEKDSAGNAVLVLGKNNDAIKFFISALLDSLEPSSQEEAEEYIDMYKLTEDRIYATSRDLDNDGVAEIIGWPTGSAFRGVLAESFYIMKKVDGKYKVMDTFLTYHEYRIEFTKDLSDSKYLCLKFVKLSSPQNTACYDEKINGYRYYYEDELK